MTESDTPDSREQTQPNIGQIAVRTVAFGNPLLKPAFHIQTVRSILFGAGESRSDEE